MSQTASELRVGGGAALVGGLGGLVGNVLHPTPPAETDALLRVVASMPHWTAIHLMIAVSAVFMVGAFGLLVRTLESERSRAVGDLARYAAVLGGAALLVSGNYSRVLGAVAMVGGAMCFLQGTSFALRVALPVPVWPLGAAVDSVWLLAVGGSVLRKARRFD